MTHPGGRGDHHPGAADVGPPAQVDVLAVEAHRRVEPAEGAEQVGADEEAGRRDGEHVGDGVVLLLVDLADVDPAGRLAEAVDVEADVLRGRAGCPTSRASGRRCRRSSGTAPRPSVARRRDRGRRRRGRSRRSRCPPRRTGRRCWPPGRIRGWPPSSLDERVGEDAADARGDVVVGAVGDEEDGAQGRVVLAGERLEHLVEPRAGGVDDDDGHDRRRGNRRPVAEHVRRPRWSEASGADVLGPSRVDNIPQHRRHARILDCRRCLQ